MVRANVLSFLSCACLTFAGVMTTPPAQAEHFVAHDSAPRREYSAQIELVVADSHSNWQAQNVIARVDASKSWVLDAAGSEPWQAQQGRVAVKARHPGARAELVGYSDLEADGEAARRGARSAAAQQLQALVWWRVRDIVARYPTVDHRRLALEVVLARVDGLVKDSVEQSIERPYGTVYRVALLVRADTETLERLTAELRRAAHAELRAVKSTRRIFLWKVGAAAMLLFIVAVLYFYLEAATQGYYTWRLRMFSLTVLLLGFAVLFGS